MYFRKGFILLSLILFGSSVYAQDLSKLSLVSTTAMIGEPLSIIIGDKMKIETLLNEGVDPHLYRPTRADIAKLVRADIIVWTGPDLESQLSRTIEKLGLSKKVITLIDFVDKDKLLGIEGKKSDPHIWMDPLLWKQALSRALEDIMDFDDKNRALYAGNSVEYFSYIEDLHLHIDELISSIPEEKRVLITAHDAFAYFGRRYGLEVYGIQGISTDSEASLRRIEDLVSIAVNRYVPALFAETSVNPNRVKSLIEGAYARGHSLKLGGVLYSDAMGKKGSFTGTYIGMLMHNARTISFALRDLEYDYSEYMNKPVSFRLNEDLSQW